MKPQRITLSRKRGWRIPPNTVVVSRPTKWGNPFRVIEGERDAKSAVELFRGSLKHPIHPHFYPDAIRRELRGKNLACWCKPGAPCHADVLLEIANT